MYTSFASQHLTVVSVSGSETSCLCPFHSDSNPSFRFNTLSGLWFCHGCKKRGNLLTLCRELSIPINGYEVSHTYSPNIHLSDLVKKLDTVHETRYCRCRETQRLIEEEGKESPYLLPGRCRLCDKPLILSEAILGRSADPEGISRFWRDRRKLHSRTITRFNLGFDPLRRAATIPYRSFDGHLLGVVYRNIGRTPKYQYPRRFPRSTTLHGSWVYASTFHSDARGIYALPRGWVALCEGPIDAMKCWDADVPAVAMWGSYLHRSQIALLRLLGVAGVVVFTDRDATGIQAARDILRALGPAGFMRRLVRYPSDWDRSLSDPGSLPVDKLRECIDNAGYVL